MSVNDPGCPAYEPDIIRKKIVAGELKFSPGEERIMRLALHYPHEIAFGTLKSLSQTCGVAPSMVARLAARLGYARIFPAALARNTTRLTG